MTPTPTIEPPIEPKWTDELRIYGEGFVGRQDELAAMDRAWGEGARIFALHAEGGAGKTRVVVEWLRRLRDDGWRGARRVFVHSFYSQGSDERRNATSELFFEHALAYFGHEGEPILQADEKGRTLARLLVEHHGLLVLDGLEPLQHPTLHAERGRLKDPGIARLLLSLANTSGGTPGLCLITSRQPVVEIEGRIGATVLQQSLDHLHRDDGAALLKQFQVTGPYEELKKASDEFRGHAYSLMLLGSYLRNATDHHDIRRRDEVLLLEEDTEHRSHARKMFAAYVRHLGEHSPEVAVLRLLGFFDRAAERELLDVLRAREGVIYEWSEEPEPDERAQPKRIEDALPKVTAPLLDLPQAQWYRVLNRLRELRLIDLTGPEKSPALDAHPLLRECFAEQVRTQFPAAWQAGHRRLFEHLSGTDQYWPEGIDGLQPLYQAVAHGCLAGLHQQACTDVYHDRILRGTEADGFYSLRKLGAIGADLGAVACFFTTPWTTPAPTLAPAVQTRLLSVTAYYLQALGRLSEAVEPMQAALDRVVQEENWEEAARSSSNLSALVLTRGEVAAAVTAGEQSMTYADHSGDAVLQMGIRTTQADALHQAGRRDESRRLFEDAESRQAALQPRQSGLSSLGSFRYCDLLLSDAERAAWQRWLGAGTGPSEMLTTTTAACDTVSERASQSLALAERHAFLLAIALDHLTLARAALYKGQPARDHITAAVDGLRASGLVEFIGCGLLTRAWVRCLSGDEAGARADLDEAWEIAERGPMPLFQADVQLTRARLFRDRAALAEARRLIEKHGYHRRDGELADAEAAAKHWKDKEPAVPTKVFISYSHDSQQHSQLVLDLANQLRKHGVDAELDQYETRPPQGWPRWCEEQLRPEISAFVLVICTETYLHRIEGKVPADEGRGVFWEGSVIYSYLYDQKSNSRFIPLVFDRNDEAYIPRPLKTSTHYRLTAFDFADAGYEALYRELTGQRAFEKPPLGDVVNLRGDQTLSGKAEDDLTVRPPVGRREVHSTFPVPEAAPAEEDLLEELKRLPPAWFDELVFRLDTNSAVSGKHAPQAMRAMDLLSVVRVLDDGPTRLQAEIQRLKRGRR